MFSYIARCSKKLRLVNIIYQVIQFWQFLIELDRSKFSAKYLPVEVWIELLITNRKYTYYIYMEHVF